MPRKPKHLKGVWELLNNPKYWKPNLSLIAKELKIPVSSAYDSIKEVLNDFYLVEVSIKPFEHKLSKHDWHAIGVYDADRS